MKKIIILALAITSTINAFAQLEFYNEQENSNTSFELLFKSHQNQTPKYHYNNRVADPSWFEEYIIEFQEEYLYPGMSVCFLKDGNVYWKNHYGFANIATSDPINDQTAYTVASISKTIMITATMQLYEQGFFELDDDIGDHIPFHVRNHNYPNTPITIKQLMTHTGSIADNYTILNSVLHDGDNPFNAYLPTNMFDIPET